MKRPLRCVVIGGVAAGTKGASKARRDDPSMEITLLTEEHLVSYAGCGLAYYIGGIVESRDSLFARSPETFRTKQNIDMRLGHRAERINTWDREVKVADLDSGTTYSLPYDRLLIATGAKPVIPSIAGISLPGVHTLHTIPDADAIKSRLEDGGVREVCIMGGGFIGVEAAENLVRRGSAVTIVEKEATLLPAMYDPGPSEMIRSHMEEKGIRILTGTAVEGFSPGADGEVAALLAGGMEFPCGLAIVAVGVRPNTTLARDAGIPTGPTGGIKVDERLETTMRGIFSAGDCTETTHLVTGKPYWLSLGSTANKMGRVAGANIAGGKKRFSGVLGTSILKVFDLAAGRTGLTEKEAKAAGFNPVSATVTTPTRAGYYPGGTKVTLTLTADRKSGRILGAQAIGVDTVDKIVDTVAGALTGALTIEDLCSLDITYSPPFSTALGTIIVAAQVLDETV